MEGTDAVQPTWAGSVWTRSHPAGLLTGVGSRNHASPKRRPVRAGEQAGLKPTSDSFAHSLGRDSSWPWTVSSSTGVAQIMEGWTTPWFSQGEQESELVCVV